MGKRPKGAREFVWQMVLVDRDLLEQARKATDAVGVSEAIDRALLLAAVGPNRRGPRPVEDRATTLRVH